MQFRNGTKNEYLYDAIGVKHRASYNYSKGSTLLPLGDTSPGNTLASTFQIDYCGNYVYEKSGTLAPRLKRILTPEGCVQTYLGLISYLPNWSYIYNLKDHQGNTRVTLTSDYVKNNTSKTYTASSQVDYYPFGLERSTTGGSGGVFNSGANPYLYSSKEIDRLNGLNQYDFSARWMDNAVPGFTTIDPLAERHYSESPYSYCGADPVNRVDPTGLDWYWADPSSFPFYLSGSKDMKGHQHAATRTICGSKGIYLFSSSGSIEFQPYSFNVVVIEGQAKGNSLEAYQSSGEGDFRGGSFGQLDGYVITGGEGPGTETKSKYTSGFIDGSLFKLSFGDGWKTTTGLIIGLIERVMDYGPTLKEAWNDVTGANNAAVKELEPKVAPVFIHTGYNTTTTTNEGGTKRIDTTSVITTTKDQNGEWNTTTKNYK